jgi:hypothetical protein
MIIQNCNDILDNLWNAIAICGIYMQTLFIKFYKKNYETNYICGM